MGESGECKLFFVVRMRSGRRRKRLPRKALDTKNRGDYHTVNLSDGGCINDRSCRRQDALEIVRRGYSGALSRFVEMFRCIVVNILILKYVGDVGISSFAASNSFLGIIWALPYGMMAVERILLSISIGEEDRTSVLNVLHIIFRRCFPLMCAVSLILVLS
ncbi:MAG: hypothetical protein II008_03735, partial [Oscillospiraceae bacterium]|nr:hypothetical protein [Oscillospiraceae bacterium]